MPGLKAREAVGHAKDLVHVAVRPCKGANGGACEVDAMVSAYMLIREDIGGGPLCHEWSASCFDEFDASRVISMREIE
jgi:hypothetical protein